MPAVGKETRVHATVQKMSAKEAGSHAGTIVKLYVELMTGAEQRAEPLKIVANSKKPPRYLTKRTVNGSPRAAQGATFIKVFRGLRRDTSALSTALDAHARPRSLRIRQRIRRAATRPSASSSRCCSRAPAASRSMMLEGELVWCSDGYERPDLRGLLESFAEAGTTR